MKIDVRRFDLEAGDVEGLCSVATELRHFPGPDRLSAVQLLSQLAGRLARQGETVLAGRLEASLNAAAPLVTAELRPPRTS